MPSCTASSKSVSLRCAHATQTSWLQNICLSAANHETFWGRTCALALADVTEGQALWQPGGAEEDRCFRAGDPCGIRLGRRHHKKKVNAPCDSVIQTKSVLVIWTEYMYWLLLWRRRYSVSNSNSNGHVGAISLTMGPCCRHYHRLWCVACLTLSGLTCLGPLSSVVCVVLNKP